MREIEKYLKNMPCEGEIIGTDDDRIEAYREDTMYRGSPDAVIIARDDDEIVEILKYCNANHIPVTFCASQTSMTGASVADGGLMISTERLDGILDLYDDKGARLIKVRPGTIVSDIQRFADENGFFYPAAPTSRDDSRIGGNINTNASGEDSYKYGPTRYYTREIEIITTDGRRTVLKRAAGEIPSRELNRAGYMIDWKNPIDLIIGSEGTLAYVSNITLSLIPKSPPFFTGLIPFRTNLSALKFAIDISLNDGVVDARAVELIDEGALEMMKTAMRFPKISDETKAFIYFKQEYESEDEFFRLLSIWRDRIAKFNDSELADETMIATTDADKEDFRLWRKRIPEAANEHGRRYWRNDGAKVGSDWWVPLGALWEMMNFFYDVADSTGLSYMGYAHIGAGHPHTNMLAKNPKEVAIAQEALLKCCKKAVELGGGITGEHGVGKLHTDLVPIQYANNIIDDMKKWKTEYDSNWILGRGNIFPATKF